MACCLPDFPYQEAVFLYSLHFISKSNPEGIADFTCHIQAPSIDIIVLSPIATYIREVLLHFIICLLLNLVVEAGLEDAIAGLASSAVAGSAVAAVVGLIPNCAVSVALTQLYLDGVLAGGAMMSGLLVNAGVGLIVLLRTNNDSRENLRICGLMLCTGIVFGLAVELLGIL